MTIRNTCLLVLLTLVMGAPAAAQQPVLTMEASHDFYVLGEDIVLQLNAEWKGQQPANVSTPELAVPGTKRLFPSNVYESTSMQNGNSIAWTTWMFNLESSQTGNLQIPPATLKVGNSTFTSNGVDVTILPADTDLAALQEQNLRSARITVTWSDGQDGDGIFRAGEVLTLHYKIESERGLRTYFVQLKEEWPGTTDFWLSGPNLDCVDNQQTYWPTPIWRKMKLTMRAYAPGTYEIPGFEGLIYVAVSPSSRKKSRLIGVNQGSSFLEKPVPIQFPATKVTILPAEHHAQKAAISFRMMRDWKTHKLASPGISHNETAFHFFIQSGTRQASTRVRAATKNELASICPMLHGSLLTMDSLYPKANLPRFTSSWREFRSRMADEPDRRLVFPPDVDVAIVRGIFSLRSATLGDKHLVLLLQDQPALQGHFAVADLERLAKEFGVQVHLLYYQLPDAAPVQPWLQHMVEATGGQIEVVHNHQELRRAMREAVGLH